MFLLYVQTQPVVTHHTYDSEPTTTSSEDESDDYGSGSDAERKREEKRKQKAEKKTKKAEKAEKKSGEPKEKRTKKKKLTRLPGQPKKNQSAYFLWMNHNREQIKKDYPGLSMTDMTKKAGELWRDLQDKTVSRIIYQVPIISCTLLLSGQYVAISLYYK